MDYGIWTVGLKWATAGSVRDKLWVWKGISKGRKHRSHSSYRIMDSVEGEK